MYDGYWTYDGVEIINVARLMAYRDNGVTPPGVKIEDCTSVCDGLSEALGHGPYRTPLLDAPPWFSVNDPASADFAGVLPLEITGTDGSVRTVQMNDAVMGGARPSRPQYGARTIGVTALLLGRTTAGVQAGLTWLTSALHQGCAGGDCGGARLTGLTVCPDIVSGQVDPTSPQIVKNAYTDIAQFTTSGIHAPIGPETGRNWAVNPSAEYGLAGISVPSYLDATGTPTNLPPGALATVPTTDSNASGSAVFQLTTPPSPAAGPLYEWHYLTPAIDTSADPTDPDVEGNPWIVRWVDSGINAVAQWRVEDDEDRVVNGLFNEDPAIGWEAGPALAALTQGPIPGGLGPSEGSGYAVLTVGDASTPTEPDGGATTVLLRQYVPLPAGMAEPTGVPQTEPRFWVDASAIVSGTDGTPVTVRVSQVEGIGGETAEFTAASTHWSYVPVSSAETGFTIANGGVWVTVEVDVDTPTGTVVQVDRLSLRLVYMNVTSVPEAGAPLAERVSAYVQPPGVPVRLSALVGTDETGATTATYQWDGVLWRPGEITTPAQFLLGDAGTFEADPGWAQAWRAESNSSLPIRSNVHAMGSSGEDIGSQGWSLLAQQGSGTGVRYGVVDLVDYVNGPGTYTARGYAFVPTSAALNQGLSVLLNGTQIAVALTATKTAWTPLTFTFTIPDATVISTLTMHATSTAASTANMMWLDNIEIVVADEWPDTTPEPIVFFDGDTPSNDDGVYAWDGTPGDSFSIRHQPMTDWWDLGAEQATVRAPSQPPVCDNVRLIWTVEVDEPQTLNLTPAVVIDGAIYEQGATTTFTGLGSVVVEMIVHDPPSQYTPLLQVTGDPDTQFRVTRMVVMARTPLALWECLGDFWRYFPEVTTVAGPTIVETIAFDCDVVAYKVEWTWVAGSAYRFGQDEQLVGQISALGGAPLVRPGVQALYNGVVSSDPWNCAAAYSLAGCAFDPCWPGFTAPPTAPVLPDPSRVEFYDDDGALYVNDVTIGVPPSLIPNEGVFSFVLENDSQPKVGVRVRVWDDALPTYEPGIDACTFAYEYLIDYLAPGATMVLSADEAGRTQRATVLCQGSLLAEEASGAVRGNFGGPLVESAVRCHRRYAVRVQWLAAYPRTCMTTEGDDGESRTVYLEGEDQGDLTISLNLAVREG